MTETRETKVVQIEEGNKLFHDGKFDDAIIKYEEATKLDKAYSLAYYNWGLSLERLGKNDEAIELYEKATKAEGDFRGMSYLSWGIILHNRNQFSEAIDKYREALELRATDAYVYSNLGLALENLGRYDEALEVYKEGEQKVPDMKDKALIYYNWGRTCTAMSRYSEAEDFYRKASRLKENYGLALHNLGYILSRTGRYQLAKEEFERAVEAYEVLKPEEKNRGNAGHFVDCANIYLLALRKLDKAETTYEEALEIDPKNVDALVGLIQVSKIKREEDGSKEGDADDLEANDHWKMSEYFRRAEEVLKVRVKQKEDAPSYYELGNLYSVMEDYGSATDMFTKAVAENPRHFRSLEELGLAHMRKENHPKAVSSLEAAVRIDPIDLGLRAELAKAYLKAGNKDKAESEAKKILEKAPFHVDALTSLAQTYTAMGEDARERKDRGEAEYMFERAVDNYKITLQLGGADKASRLLSKTELSVLNFELGLVQVRLWDYQVAGNNTVLNEARANFEKVEKRTPNYFKAHRVIERIDKKTNLRREVTSRFGPMAIVVLSALVFLMGQTAFFIGKPSFGQSNFSLDKQKVTERISKGALDSTVVETADYQNLTKLRNLFGTVFNSREHYENELRKVFSNEAAEKLLALDVLVGSKALRFDGFDALGSGAYALMTFGGLIFMIAGFFLRETSRLKFGAIELEKSTIELGSATGSEAGGGSTSLLSGGLGT